MTRTLFQYTVGLIVVSSLMAASIALAEHRSAVRGPFGGVRAARHVERTRHVERERTGPLLPRLRGITGGGCIGTVTHVRAQTAPAGCSGWTGPGWVVPSKVVPGVMVPHKK